MKKRRLVQFRLATLLVTVVLVALGVSAWQRFVVPNVTGFHFEQGNLVLHLSDRLGRELLPDDPYFNALSQDPDVFVHSTFISFPIYVLAVGLILIGLLGLGLFFALRKLVALLN